MARIATTPMVGLARAAVGGLVMTGAPQLVAVLRGPRGAVTLARVLGLRDVVQGALMVARPSTTVLRAGAVVDGLHLTTMVAAAALVRDARRLAGAAAAQAALELAADLHATRTRAS